MDIADMPVTLVVKTPNQSVKDLKIDCGLKWSVHRLKQHLSQVYPGKPQMAEQKLIYSGRLLQGPEVLKDILKHTYDEGQTTHTVHLLCMSHFAESSDNTKQPSSSTPQPSNSQSSPLPNPAAHTSQSPHTTEGLRHRHTHTSHHNTHTSSHQDTHTSHHNTQTSHHHNYAQYYGGAFGVQADGTMPAMLPGMAYSPEQMMWLQQMYTQQMAHYMQYMQQGYPGVGHAVTSSADMAAAHAHLHNQAVAPGVAGAQAIPAGGVAPPGANRGGDQQQMVMNAAGGQAMFEDEEEGNRDWLDMSYILCRFGVLLMIVYFYSSISRFLMVFGFFIMIWLYQAGYLRIARRNNERPADRQADRQQEQQQQQENNENLPVINEVDGAANDNAETPEEGPEMDENETETTVGDNTENVPPPPGVARVALSFFVTFFTSLIPAPPEAVNAN